MGASFEWTPEEADYIKAALEWQDESAAEKAKRRREDENERLKKRPVAEFRLLVIGAQGAGKTAVLTRFGQNKFPDATALADDECACRRAIVLDRQVYMVDVLEMPSRHLGSTSLLEQAVAITEAAILLYDVRDAASFRLARGLAEYVRVITSGVGAGHVSRRDYGLMLVGNKCEEEYDQQQPARAVSWAEARQAALGLSLPPARIETESTTNLNDNAGSSDACVCGVLEVSAKTGENVDKLFSQMAIEVLRLRWLNQQRRDESANMLVRARLGDQKKSPPRAAAPASPEKLRAVDRKPSKRSSFWGKVSTPFLRKQAV